MKSIIGLCAFAFTAWLLVPSAAQAQLDHYKCYQGKDSGNPKFVKTTALTSDQIVPSETVKVQKVKFVCNPVKVGVNGVINDESAHLTCYQIKGANLASGPIVQVSTQFGVSEVELKKPKLLCVPSTKTIVP